MRLQICRLNASLSLSPCLSLYLALSITRCVQKFKFKQEKFKNVRFSTQLLNVLRKTKCQQSDALFFACVGPTFPTLFNNCLKFEAAIFCTKKIQLSIRNSNHCKYFSNSLCETQDSEMCEGNLFLGVHRVLKFYLLHCKLPQTDSFVKLQRRRRITHRKTNVKSNFQLQLCRK